MKMCAGFLVGMGAGLVTGAALGMMTPYGKDSMKTQVMNMRNSDAHKDDA